jgi:hypothetical protein
VAYRLRRSCRGSACLVSLRQRPLPTRPEPKRLLGEANGSARMVFASWPPVKLEPRFQPRLSPFQRPTSAASSKRNTNLPAAPMPNINSGAVEIAEFSEFLSWGATTLDAAVSRPSGCTDAWSGSDLLLLFPLLGRFLFLRWGGRRPSRPEAQPGPPAGPAFCAGAT